MYVRRTYKLRCCALRFLSVKYCQRLCCCKCIFPAKKHYLNDCVINKHGFHSALPGEFSILFAWFYAISWRLTTRFLLINCWIINAYDSRVQCVRQVVIATANEIEFVCQSSNRIDIRLYTGKCIYSSVKASS